MRFTLIVAALTIFSAGCIEHLAAFVRIEGSVQERTPSESCLLSLAPTIGEAKDRRIQGKFSEKFIVQPGMDRYELFIKCDDEIRLKRTLSYSDFRFDALDLGHVRP